MTANSIAPVSFEMVRSTIHTLVQQCLKAEEHRSLSANSLKELRRYLKEFTIYCREQRLTSVKELTPVFLKTYAADRHGKVITKALMGHQRLTTTEIYTHLSPSYFRPLAQGHPFHSVTEGKGNG